MKNLIFKIALAAAPYIIDLVDDKMKDAITDFARTFYQKAQDTAPIWDDLATGLLKDIVTLAFEREGKNFVFDDDLRVAASRMYYTAKETENPYDDILAGALFAMLGMKTPAKQ